MLKRLLSRMLLPMLLVVAPAMGSLPPTAESIREIDTVIHSEQLYELLGSADPIQSIIATSSGYLIVTGKMTLQVEVVRNLLEGGMVGPSKLELVFIRIDTK